jgi:hypothetical protein
VVVMPVMVVMVAPAVGVGRASQQGEGQGGQNDALHGDVSRTNGQIGRLHASMAHFSDWPMNDLP